MIKEILKQLINYQAISRDTARDILINITRGEYNQSEVVAFLTVFMMRPITVYELAGFRDALLELCTKVDFSDFNTIDMCGTGGDNKDTFNISTLASFVVAGTGAKVAKHGNYGVSSNCGSSNVMEHLGYKFTADQDLLKRQLDKAGICMLHAPLFNSAMKSVAPIRKELGMKTFFNMLGPMVNPSSPQNQIVGVFSLELARLYNYIYQEGDKNYAIIHSLDGYDEISLTDKVKVITNEGEKLYLPEDMGFNTINPNTIFGGETVADSAAIFVNVIEGKGTREQNEVVIANAGMALHTIDNTKPLNLCFADAQESLMSGKAKNVLKTLLTIN